MKISSLKQVCSIGFIMTVVFLAENVRAAEISQNTNQLNSKAISEGFAISKEDFNRFQDRLRSPSGFLYPDVLQPAPLKPIANGDWSYSLSMDAGYLLVAGEENSSLFAEYGDWNDGFLLRQFSGVIENSQTAQYMKLSGGSIGRNDQYLNFSSGKYGKYNLSVAFDSVPHVFSNDAKVLWEGVGRNVLTLPGGLTPGNSTAAEVITAFQLIQGSEIKLDRDKLSVNFDIDYLPTLNFHAKGSVEWREGGRPFGGGFTYPGSGQVTEVIEPVDYTTYDINLGFSYSNTHRQLNFSYSGSFFENSYSALTWENPGLTPFPAFAPSRGRYALAPDNEYHHFRSDFATLFPFWNSRFTLVSSYSISRQNDLLVPPTVSTGIINSGPDTIDLDQWNSVAALSSERAGAEVRDLMVHSRMILNPVNKLRLNAELKIHDKDNRTDYTALNPFTGQYGYLVMDGGLDALAASLSGIYNPLRRGSRVRFKNIPFEKDIFLIATGVDYRFTGKLKMDLDYTREQQDFSHREVDKLVEDRIDIKLVYRSRQFGTLRTAYEFSSRDSDNYNFNPYEQFYTSSLPDHIPRFTEGNDPHTLANLRKYDLASRDRHAITGKFISIIADNIDLTLTGKYSNEDFDAEYGLKDKNSFSANVDLNFYLGLNKSIYAFYSFQSAKRSFSNINDAGAVSAVSEAGGPRFPLDRAWHESTKETNNNFGAGFNYAINSITFNASYTYAKSRSRFHYDYNSTAAFNNTFTEQEVGSGFPDQVYSNHQLEAEINWSVNEKTSLNFLYKYEAENINDFHYQGLVDSVISDSIFLLTVPDNFKNHVIGITIEYNF